MSLSKTTFINCTDASIYVKATSDKVTEFPVSGISPKVESLLGEVMEVEGFLMAQRMNKLTGLPVERKGVILIVTEQVMLAAWNVGRKDCVTVRKSPISKLYCVGFVYGPVYQKEPVVRKQTVSI